MEVIQRKLDNIILLLKEIVDNTNMEVELIDERQIPNAMLSRDVIIDIPQSMQVPRAPPVPHLGENEITQFQNNEINDNSSDSDEQFDVVRIGEYHRLIEEYDSRENNYVLILQYWNGHDWIERHTFN